MNTLRSKIYPELREKRITKHLAPFVIVGLVLWVGFMWQELNAVKYANYYYGTATIYHLN